jgi:vacuolar-type H+-ATPase subunit I/STV1
MTEVETAKTLSLVGAILSIVFGIVYFLWGIAQVAIFYNTYNGYWYGSSYWILLGLSFVIYGIISLIFGILTLAVARKCLFDASTLKSGAIMCFIFGGISAAAIGGILTIIAGILAIIAWDEQRKAAEAPPRTPPPETPSTAAIFCKYCGASVSPEATFCSSCGKRLKK